MIAPGRGNQAQQKARNDTIPEHFITVWRSTHEQILLLLRCCVAFVMAAMPLAAQQEVPMRGNTPVAPQGIKIAAAARRAGPL